MRRLLIVPLLIGGMLVGVEPVGNNSGHNYRVLAYSAGAVKQLPGEEGDDKAVSGQAGKGNAGTGAGGNGTGNVMPARTGTVKRVLILEATAYADRGPTKSGPSAGPGVVSVDPKVIPLGSRVYVEGYGYARALDTGKYINGHRIDVWFSSVSRANRWGRKPVKVHVYHNQ